MAMVTALGREERLLDRGLAAVPVADKVLQCLDHGSDAALLVLLHHGVRQHVLHHLLHLLTNVTN